MHFINTKLGNQKQSSKRKDKKMYNQCYLYFTNTRATLLFINELANIYYGQENTFRTNHLTLYVQLLIKSKCKIIMQ